MRRPAFLLGALLCLFAALLLIPRAFGQAATQTEHWCPELGALENARGVLWADMWHAYTLTDDGIALLEGLDTSNTVQAYYGDPNTDADDQWLGAPTDLQPFLQFTVETDAGKRWIGFAESPSEPDVLLGMALLSRAVSGSGDRRGMHDICAVFVTDRASVEAIWAASVPADAD